MPQPDKGYDPRFFKTEREEMLFRGGAICGILLVVGCVVVTWLMTGQWPDYCGKP